MGNKISKQVRKLPSSNMVKATTNNLKASNTPTKIQFQQANSSHLQDATDSNLHQEQSTEAIHKDSSVNKNVDRIGQVQIEEIPLKLDQNNPALRTLRNKIKREEDLKQEPKENETRKTVHPSVLCGIIEDLHSIPADKLKKSYNVDDDFLKNLGTQLKIATTKIKLKEASKREDEELDENRINGIQPSRHSTDYENHLEQLMGSNAKN